MRDSNKNHYPVRKIYRKPKLPEKKELSEGVLKWFTKRCISNVTLDTLNIHKTYHWFPQTQQDTPCISFPYIWKEETRNIKYRDADKNFAQEKDAEPTLYNADCLKEHKSIIWVEGEMDVASFIEAGLNNVVTLPNGAPQSAHDQSEKRFYPLETHAEELETIDKFYIATDCDEKGEYLAQELARRLGRDRCYRIRFPTINDVFCKDANDCLVTHGKEVLREQLDIAEPWPIDGLYEGNAFKNQVIDLYHGRGPKPYSLLGGEFDRAIKVIPGQFIVITGIPNHGKSFLLDQIAVNTTIRHGWKWSIFSPETSEDQHIADLCSIYQSKPFFDGPNPKMNEEQLYESIEWVNDNFMFIASKDHTPSIDWILEKARASVLRHGINNLIIDPYNEIEAGRVTGMTETEFVSQLISKCKRFGRNHGCTVWLVAHPKKIEWDRETGQERIPSLYDISGSAHFRNKADAGIVIYRDYAADKTIIQSPKIRRQPMCGQPGEMDFMFLGNERKFEEISGTYTQFGRRRKKG